MTGDLPPCPREIASPGLWQDLSPEDQYGNFDRLITQARDRGVFETLPESRAAALDQAYEKQGETMAEQLWLLGYLEAEDKHGARSLFHDNRKAFLEAAGRFQAEAGLKPDKWTGPKTREALANLVNFESDHLEVRWLDAPPTYPAILRAAQCRLFALGLAPDGPDTEFSGLSFAAMKKFKRMALALKALPPTQEPGTEKKEIETFLNTRTPTPALLALLLDQDRLIRAVAAACTRDGDAFNIPCKGPDRPHLPQEYMIRRFLTRLVQVELWLMGYEIPLTGQLFYPVQGIDKINRLDCDPALQAALTDFAGLAGKDPDTWGRAITPELFILLDAAQAPLDDPALDREVAGRFKTPESIETALQTGRRLHLRLWDGIKRVLRWIKALFVKTVNTILDLGRTLARFFYSRAMDAFESVKQAVRITTEAMATLDGTRIHTAGTCIRVFEDGDVVIGISPGAGPGQAQKAVSLMGLNAERFCLAARICSLVLSGLVSTILNGWAALAWVLFEKGRECIRQMKKIRRLENQMEVI